MSVWAAKVAQNGRVSEAGAFLLQEPSVHTAGCALRECFGNERASIVNDFELLVVVVVAAASGAWELPKDLEQRASDFVLNLSAGND